MKIGGEYILSRRSIARMIATITAALMTFYAATTAQAQATVHRIHDATVALVSLDRQMVGRLTRTVVPDFMYLEYKSLYLMLKPSVALPRRDPPAVTLSGGTRSCASAPTTPETIAARPEAVTSATAPVTATTADIQRAVDEIKLTVRKAVREVIKDAHSARMSEADRRIPNGARGRQIASVRKLVREARAAGKQVSILRACRKVWQNIKGGYPSPEALYAYCHSHRAEFSHEF